MPGRDRQDALDAEDLMDWPTRVAARQRSSVMWHLNSGAPVTDMVLDIPTLSHSTKDAPRRILTQKPLKLLDRIIKASSSIGQSSNPGPRRWMRQRLH